MPPSACRSAAPVLAVATALWLAAPPAHAQVRGFNVPAQAASRGIRSFARQARIQVAVAGSDSEGRRTNAIRGSLDTRAALEQLLSGSGLVLRSFDGKIAILGAEPTAETPSIVVTALKREQTPLEVAAALVTLSGDQIRQAGVKHVMDLSGEVPGLMIDAMQAVGPSNQGYTIRGVGSDDPRPNSSPAVAVHYDGIYQASNALLAGMMFDVERVEVLMGPQGTLYGRNSTAGAINVISRKPDTQDYGGDLHLEYGRFDSLRADGALNIPLSGELAVRIAAVYDRTDGYVTNLGSRAFAGITPAPGIIPPNPDPGVDTKAGEDAFRAARVLVAYDPAEGTSLLFNLHGSHDTGGTAEPQHLLAAPDDPPPPPYSFSSDFKPRLNIRSLGMSLTLTQDLTAGMQLIALGGWEHMERYYRYNNSAYRLFDMTLDDKVDQESLEVRLQSRGVKRLTWVVGGVLFNDDMPMDTWLDSSDSFRTVFFTPYHQRRQSWAVFGDATYGLTSRIKLDAGLRYTVERSTFSGSTLDLDPYGLSTHPYPLPFSFDNHYEGDSPSGKITLSYTPDEDTGLWLSYGHGFKAGGFDGTTAWTPPEALPYKAEQLDAYEAGLKLLPRHPGLQAELSAFYYDYSNMQNTTTKEGPAGVFTSIRTNVGRSRIYGGEISLTSHPLQPLTLRLSGSFLNSEILDYVSDRPSEVLARVGRHLPFAPSATVNASVRYEIPLGGSLMLTPMIQGRYVSHYFAELDNLHAIGGYFLGDARLDLRIGEHLTVGAFVRDFTNRPYVVGTQVTNTTTFNVLLGEPRTYGICVARSF